MMLAMIVFNGGNCKNDVRHHFPWGNFQNDVRHHFLTSFFLGEWKNDVRHRFKTAQIVTKYRSYLHFNLGRVKLPQH